MSVLISIGSGVKSSAQADNFGYNVDRFADVEILRYNVPDFDKLSIGQKRMIYCLNQAALEGRDILYDQNYKHNLLVRRTIEAMYLDYNDDRSSSDFKAFETYLKQVWMGNGIHHHYSGDKFKPAFSEIFFKNTIEKTDPTKLPLEGKSVQELFNLLQPILFNPEVDAKRINQEPGKDLIITSANNYYENVSQKEVEDFYAKMKDPNDKTPISYGLNSKLVKIDGKLEEQTYKIGGMYSAALEKVVYWLEEAALSAENEIQRNIILSLVAYYRTGDLRKFDEYCIKWVQDVDSQIDFVNGFTETYGDPLGIKASWESCVNFKNLEATKRTEIISNNAQWFEDNSPIDPQFKKEEVKGVSAKVITVTMLGGDCYPATPIGINLPNSNWIRKDYGSKSVTIQNITDAYNGASIGSGFSEEFLWSPIEIDLAKKYGATTGNLHVDMHECLGHGSGKLLPETNPESLRAYRASTEEARADLFGLYYIGDKKMVELGLLPNNEAYKTQYYQYILTGAMTQLIRIEPGKNIEQAHMRNRALIANWVLEKGKGVAELVKKNGKTYLVIYNYEKLRDLFGQLLAEIQRIKSTGDFDAAKKLTEKYAVKVNPKLHAEVLERYKKLNIAPYKGFVNPIYEAVRNEKGEIVDVKINFSENYVNQNLRYSKEYSHLPILN